MYPPPMTWIEYFWSHQSDLSKRLGHILDELTLREGMILVTCSGMNLGLRLFGLAGGMDGLVASHDLIRIEVDAAKIPPELSSALS